MNSLAEEISARVLTLPEQAQQEALDFIEFLQIKMARQSRTIQQRDQSIALADTEELSPLYQAFAQAGLIGCIETDEQLSTTYKEKLDFSLKHGKTR